MKRCTKCKELKDETEYHKSNKLADGLVAKCKSCVSIRAKAYYRNNPKVRQRVAERSEINKERAREWLFDYLLEHPCVDCEELDPCALEFDHLRDKKRNISKMLGNGCSPETLMKEIEKCVVRCASCHRKKTAKDQGWFTYRMAKARGLIDY